MTKSFLTQLFSMIADLDMLSGIVTEGDTKADKLAALSLKREVMDRIYKLINHFFPCFNSRVFYEMKIHKNVTNWKALSYYDVNWVETISQNF